MRAILLLISVLFGGMVAGPSARAQIEVWSEDFDGVTPPEAPAGWAFGNGWETSGSSASPGSGGNNLMQRGSQAGSADTPVIDLTHAGTATLTYLSRRTASYDVANLSVEASADGGATFPFTVLEAGAALTEAASSYEQVSAPLPAALLGSAQVVLRFHGHGLSSSSSNARLDDIALTIADITGANGTLAFSVPESRGTGEDPVAVPLKLGFGGADGIQGLQFRISWGSSPILFHGVTRGASLADSASWSVDFESDGGFVDVVILGRGTRSLEPGSYDPLLTLELTGAALVATLEIAGVVAALATPASADAGIFAGPGVHTLTFGGGSANFVASTTSLDVGSADVGTTATASLVVTNGGGVGDLLITEAACTNPLFGISPSAAAIAPDSSREFTVTFSPSVTSFGRQDGELIFNHNGEHSPSSISITGKGRGGRGDAEGDGTVDVLDIVYAIDFVLARISPGPAQAAAADLFPFPAGEGDIDVRDLTVLSQAIAKGAWPDGIPLPVEETGAGKAGAGVAYVELEAGPGGETVIRLEHDVSIRGFQLILAAAQWSPVVGDIDDLALTAGYDAVREEVRILAYEPGGEARPPGVGRITVRRPVGALRYAAAIGRDRERIMVVAPYSTHVHDERADAPIPGLPYPNPYLAGSGSLRISHPAAAIEIFDLLGRRIFSFEGEHPEWHGRDASGRLVSPGLYFVVSQSGGARVTRPVTVLR